MIPLLISSNSYFFLPLFYGIGSALPIFVFGFLIFFSVALVNKFYRGIAKYEIWARKITGVIFLLVGIYYVLAYIFKII